MPLHKQGDKPSTAIVFQLRALFWREPEGEEKTCTFPFLLLCVADWFEVLQNFPPHPHLSKPRSVTPLENNQSELWAALKSPLLSYYKRPSTVSSNEHYKSYKHSALNNNT